MKKTFFNVPAFRRMHRSLSPSKHKSFRYFDLVVVLKFHSYHIRYHVITISHSLIFHERKWIAFVTSMVNSRLAMNLLNALDFFCARRNDGIRKLSEFKDSSSMPRKWKDTDNSSVSLERLSPVFKDSIFNKQYDLKFLYKTC